MSFVFSLILHIYQSLSNFIVFNDISLHLSHVTTSIISLLEKV